MELQNRRNFLKKAGIIATTGFLPLPSFANDLLKEDEDVFVKKPMARKNPDLLVNSYYYAPHNHSLLTQHLDYDLAKMVSIGTDIVTFCVQEDQLDNWNQQRIRNVVDRAHEHGLKVHVVPNRWTGLTAGWLDGYSSWSIRNTDTWLPGTENQKNAFSDPNNPKVEEWYKKNLERLFNEFNFDGLVWDEPRPFNNVDVFYFLDKMTAYIKTLKPDAPVSIFAESTCLHLKDTFPKLKHIDYLGSDGHVRSEDHKMKRMKTTIFEAHKAFYEPLKKAGKKTFFLLEAHRHRDADLENYLQNMDKAFNLPMDHLMYYYSAHEMSIKNEKIFNEATWKTVAALKGISYKSGN